MVVVVAAAAAARVARLKKVKKDVWSFGVFGFTKSPPRTALDTWRHNDGKGEPYKMTV